MKHLSRIVFVVTFGFTFSPGLKLGFDLGEPLDAIRKTTETLVGAPVDREVFAPSSSENLVNGRTRNVVLLGQRTYSLPVTVIGLVDLLTLKRRQPCALVNSYRGLLLGESLQPVYPENVNNARLTHTFSVKTFCE